MKVELKSDRFRRLPKNPSKEEIELKEERIEKRNLERQGRDKNKEDIEYSDDLIVEIRKDIKKTKAGCYPYLKSSQPMYAWHSYDEYGIKQEDDEFDSTLI